MAMKLLTIADLRGGRNGADPPLALPDNQAVEMLNVDHFDGLLARKRGGCDNVALTGGTSFSSGLQTLIRHVPGSDETVAELWGIDGAPIVKRLTGGTAWADVTLDDAISTRPQDVVGASLNGKLFLAYDSTVDRLHVYDPNLASARVRRVGLATPAAPTVADSGGAGAIAANLRYVRIRWGHFTATTAGLVYRRSEPGASLGFTPDGAHANVTVTRPTAAGEGETHWEIELSADNATFYRVFGQDVNSALVGGAAIVIATTTQTVGGTWTTGYTSGAIGELTGFYSRFPSVKSLITDGNRLIGAGAWETAGADSGGKGSRVWYTPVLGSSDKGDDERVPNQVNQKNWVDLNENDGGAVTGLGGPINGVPFAFKYRQVWKLTPTGDATVPYLPRKLSDVFGAIGHKTICVAKDAAGNPAIYFLSADGPCRLLVAGGITHLQYLGRDVEDIWATVNLSASAVVAFGIYFPYLHQVWFWIATGSNTEPDTKIVFDVLLGRFTEGERVRGGWYKHTGGSATARCAVLFANTLGASMSRDQKPYIGLGVSSTLIVKAETTTATDSGTQFQAYIKTKPLAIAALGQNVGIGPTSLLAKAGSAVTITQTIDRDYGLETRTATCLLTAAGSETRVLRKIEGSDMSQAGTIQIQLGDSAALSQLWTLDGIAIPVRVEDPR